MTTTQSTTHTEERVPPTFIGGFTRLLDAWRGLVDELVVQADLASMDAREGLHERLQTAENAYLAAKAGMMEGLRGSEGPSRPLRHQVEAFFTALDHSYQNADQVVRRASAHRAP